MRVHRTGTVQRRPPSILAHLARPTRVLATVVGLCGPFLLVATQPVWAADVSLRLDCPPLEEMGDRLDAFEARSRLELSLARRRGTVELTCSEEILVRYVPAEGAPRSARVGWAPDDSLVDRLVLTVSALASDPAPSSAPPQESSKPEQQAAEKVEPLSDEDATAASVIWGMRGGGSVEFWSPGGQPAIGGRLQALAALGPWLVGVGAMLQRQGRPIEGFDLWGYRLLLSGERTLTQPPWVIDLGLSSALGLYRAKAPPAYLPAIESAFGWSATASTMFGFAARRWKFALGPEITANIVRPRLVLGDVASWQQQPFSWGGSAALSMWF